MGRAAIPPPVREASMANKTGGKPAKPASTVTNKPDDEPKRSGKKPGKPRRK